MELIPIPNPDLSTSERLIREQLQLERSKLLVKTQNQKVQALDKSNAFGQMGQLYHIYEFWQAAETCYRNALSLIPREFRWTYLLGHLSEGQGKLQEAVDRYQRALTIKPNNLPTLLRLAEIQLTLNRLDLAEQLFQKAISIESDLASAVALTGLGKISIAMDNPKQAIQYFKKALEIQPQANSLHYQLAMSYRHLEKLEIARQHLQKHGLVQPSFHDPIMENLRELKTGKQFFWSQGSIALSEGKYTKAVESFRKMLKADPNEPLAHMDLGTSLLQLGDVSGALNEYQRALDLSSGNPRLHYNLGLVYTLQNSYSKALEHYRRAINLDPELEEAHFNAANLLMRMKNQREAKQHYAKVIALNPSDTFARFMQAMASIRMGRYQDAQSLLEESRRAFPKDLDITHALARLLAASPDKQFRNGPLALKLLQEIFNTGQEVIGFEHIETLAMAFAETRQFEKALQIQQTMIQEISQTGRNDLVKLLEENLYLYQNGQTCQKPWRDDDPVFSPVLGGLVPLHSSSNLDSSLGIPQG